jgi:ParB/RepB/Spo0J family partition protein
MSTKSKCEVVWLDPAMLTVPYEKANRVGTKVEDADLNASINERGILDPLIVTRKRRRVLDGHRRRNRALVIGMKTVPCVLVDDQDDEEEWARAVVLNADRRHLTPGEKLKLIDQLLQREPDASNRTIAKAANATHKTVGKRRTRLESTGALPQFTERKGADGKVRRAKPTKQSTAPARKEVARKGEGSDAPAPRAIPMPAAERVTAPSADSVVAGGPIDDDVSAPQGELRRLARNVEVLADELNGLAGALDVIEPASVAQRVRNVVIGLESTVARLKAWVNAAEPTPEAE